MLWFVRMMAEHSDMKIAATCHGPADMTGTSLSVVTEGNLHCSEYLEFFHKTYQDNNIFYIRTQPIVK